jgi:hypothetical protein
MGNATTDDRRVAEIIDIIAFKTLHMLFGEDNDTAGGSDNETDGVAYGSTLYAGGEIDWQTRIRTWFRTEYIGKLNLIIEFLSWLIDLAGYFNFFFKN